MDEWRRKAGESWSKPPDALYHYTSGQGFHGILTSNSLWGGNYAFMNDRSEFQYARDLLSSMLAVRLEKVAHSTTAEVMKAAMHPLALEGFDLYVACFCEEPDLLSQWRGYGGQDSRYCLHFATAHLKVADERVSPVLSVIYDEAEQRRWLDAWLDIHERAFEKLPADFDDECLALAVRCLVGCTLPLLMRFKSAAFREEKEWRCARYDFPGLGTDASELHFVNTSGFMKPYRTMLKGRRDGGEKLPLLQVIAGASRSDLQSVKSAWLMLRRFGYEEVPIALSEVPLHTWSG
jgi:hypothetical protein